MKEKDSPAMHLAGTHFQAPPIDTATKEIGTAVKWHSVHYAAIRLAEMSLDTV